MKKADRDGFGKADLMKPCFAIAAVILAVSAVMAGCGKVRPEEGITYDKDTMYITLGSNPTTGFTWDAQISDPNVLAFVSDVYKQTEGTEGTTGSGGYDTFTFRGLAEGTAVVTLTYARQWEGGETGEIREVTVNVAEDKTITSNGLSVKTP